MGAFLATLVAATVLSPTSRDSVNPFASAATQALVERAMARQRTQDSAVTDYTASLRYRLTVSMGRRRWGRSAPAAVEEQEARVTWAAPNNLLVDIVGRRERVEQPGAQAQEHLGPTLVRGSRPHRLDPPLQRRLPRDRPAASARGGRAALVPLRARRQPAGDAARTAGASCSWRWTSRRRGMASRSWWGSSGSTPRRRRRCVSRSAMSAPRSGWPRRARRGRTRPVRGAPTSW